MSRIKGKVLAKVKDRYIFCDSAMLNVRQAYGFYTKHYRDGYDLYIVQKVHQPVIYLPFIVNNKTLVNKYE